MNECNIVQDLLPLYADDLVSEDSVEFIDRHAENCPKCRDIWRRYKGELPVTHPTVSEEQAQVYRKPIKQGLWKLVMSALMTWLVLFVVLGYFVWEIGWLGAEKQLVSPDGEITFTVKDYSNAGFFHKGGAYVLTPDGQGRDLRGDETFVDLHVWWAPNEEAFFAWWEFTDHDEAYFVDYRDIEAAGGWKDYKASREMYREDIFADLEKICEDMGLAVIGIEFARWSDGGRYAYFLYHAEQKSGFLEYDLDTKTVQFQGVRTIEIPVTLIDEGV